MNWLKIWVLEKFFLKPLVEEFDDKASFNFGVVMSAWMVRKIGLKRWEKWKEVLKTRIASFLDGLTYGFK